MWNTWIERCYIISDFNRLLWFLDPSWRPVKSLKTSIIRYRLPRQFSGINNAQCGACTDQFPVIKINNAVFIKLCVVSFSCTLCYVKTIDFYLFIFLHRMSNIFMHESSWKSTPRSWKVYLRMLNSQNIKIKCHSFYTERSEWKLPFGYCLKIDCWFLQKDCNTKA